MDHIDSEHINTCSTTHTCSSFFQSISCLHQSPVVSRGQTHQQQFHDKRFDLLSDLGGDIFAAPPNMNAGTSSGFANFAHFNSHTSKKQTNKWLSNISKAKHVLYTRFDTVWVLSTQVDIPKYTKYVTVVKTQESDLLRHKAESECRKWTRTPVTMGLSILNVEVASVMLFHRLSQEHITKYQIWLGACTFLFISFSLVTSLKSLLVKWPLLFGGISAETNQNVLCACRCVPLYV